MIAIIDYDAGNIRSVEKAFLYLGQETVVTRERDEILAADHIVLPGVGAFGDAMAKLSMYDLIGPIREAVEKDIPFLGICLGLQLLFEDSEESPGVPGLGLLPGHILRIPDSAGLKIPHIGWNSLDFDPAGNVRDQYFQETESRRLTSACGRGRLFEGLPEESYVYFVHSYYLRADDEAIVKASCEYGTMIHASVESGNLFACQFHPEKSGETGLKILRNFLKAGKQ